LELTEAKHLLNGVIRAIEVEEALALWHEKKWLNG
jgi:hypothetical protein